MAIYLQNARIDFQMNGKQQVELRSLYLSVSRAMCICKIRTLYSKTNSSVILTSVGKVSILTSYLKHKVRYITQ